jgi:glycosyltransferase involved in cell wall biosynthesis
MSWYKERIRWRLLNRATRHAQRTIAVSEGVRSAIGAALPIDDKDVPLIRNGVPLPATLCRVHATTRSAIVGDDGDATVWPKVICVGRLIESKGHNQLIAAIPAVLRRFPGARFSFFGDGPTRSELFRQAQRLGVEHRVFFAGTVDDVASVFEASDIFVSPSHYEGLSMSVLEAMSFGMPVVVSNIPGHLKVIWDGVSGLTYELGRADELAEKIALVAGQPQLARRLGSEARSLVEREYDVREMAAAYECLYAG